MKRVKATGAIVMASATIVREAVWLEEQGTDVIIAQGAEAGGHRGMFLTENIAEQPGTASVKRTIMAASAPAASGPADAIVLYTPEDRVIKVKTAALPPGHAATWFDPRTGTRSDARGSTGHSRTSTSSPARKARGRSLWTAGTSTGRKL